MLSLRIRTIFLALFVTFIWSLSWVLLKIGLEDIPPLTFAGLRYTIAAGCLLVLALRRPKARVAIRHLTPMQWRWLLLLGLAFYAIAQGAQFMALVYLPAVTFGLILNFVAIAVALMGIMLLAEIPSGWQWFGIGLSITGALIYFWPVNFPKNEVIGLGLGAICVLANAIGAIVGRYLNRDGSLPALVVTVVSMTIGAVLLLITGLITQGLPPLSLTNWLLIIWLAVVHTAFTFTMWNVTLRTLNAVESSIIGNTMMIQIALLAWLFLGETITARGGLGLMIALVGTLVVQLTPQSRQI